MYGPRALANIDFRLEFPAFSGGAGIAVMQTADVRNGDYLALLRKLDGARIRSVLLQ